MSIHALTSLDAYCDQCKRSFGEALDEPATAPGLGHWQVGKMDARRDMKTYGWTAVKRDGRLIDLCPTCSAAALQEATL